MKKIWIQKALSLKSLVAQHWLQTAWCMVGFKTQTHTNMQTQNLHVNLCMHMTCFPGHTRHTWVCTHAKSCTKDAQDTCTDMHALITDAHVYIQVPDYSWDIHTSTSTHMHLIMHACPECSIYSHTEHAHICAHWLHANEYSCIGRRKEELFLGIMFFGDTKKYQPVVFHIAILSQFKFFQLAS